MILPSTYTTALLLTVLSMLCWGSWANTQKLTGKWRFELYYFDYALGVLVCALIAAFTFGSLDTQEISVFDTLVMTGKRKMAWAFFAGVVFNLANMLLVAAISISGLAVAFPIGIGLALVIGVIWNYSLNPQGNPALLFGGAALVAIAIVVDAIAYKTHAASVPKETVAAGLPASSAQQPYRRPGRSSSSSRRADSSTPSALKGILISLLSGVLMGSFYPFVQLARMDEDGVKPYADALLFSAGVFLSTFPFSFFFMVVPIQGRSVSLLDYLRGTIKQHLLGLAGGLIWCAGAVSNFIASSAPAEVHVGPAVSYAMGQGATAVSVLWGLLVWREFAGATAKVKGLLVLMLLLFIVGLGLVSIAPLYG